MKEMGSIIHMTDTKQEEGLESISVCLASEPIVPMSGIRLMTVLLALVLGIFMASSNENMVYSALGGIINDLHASSDFTWVISSYFLLTTASQPLYGKLSDIFGRRSCLMVAALIFIVGSIGSGASNSLPMLAMFRGLDGIGSGGLYSLGYVIIGDLIPLNRRGSIMGILQITYGVAGVVGVITGGLLVDYVSWRWVFYVTVPMGILVLIGSWWTPSNSKPLKQQFIRIDFGGAFTLVLGTMLITIGCNWGGKDFPWSSWQVLGCLCGGIVLLIGFVLIEMKVSEPIIPFRIIRGNTICTVLISVAFGVVLLNLSVNMPGYFQNVQGHSPTKVGCLTIPIPLLVSLTAAISGFISDRMRSPIQIMRLGTFLMVVGSLLGFLIRSDITMVEEFTIITFLSIGIGFNIQSTIFMAQASNDQSDMAVATTLVRYAFAFGGSIGLTIHGSIFNNILIYQLKSTLPPSPELTKMLASPTDLINNLTKLTELSHLIKLCLITSYKYLFVSLVGFASLGFIASLFLTLPTSLQSKIQIQPE